MESTAEKRKNIVLIVMDDANSFWHFRSIFGEELSVPNFDRICGVSTAFHSAFCQVAACGPSRASFMSGLAPHQTGIFDTHRDIFNLIRPDQMWAYRLKQAGYYCSNAGKIHHGYRAKPPAIHNVMYSHKAVRLRFGPAPHAEMQYYGAGDNSVGTTNPADDAKYYDHQSADSAIAFFDSYDRDAPFYREIGFHAPHVPTKTPARFKEMYDHKRFVMPRGWAGWSDISQYSKANFGPNINVENEERWQETLRNYFSALSHIDWHIGRVWDALKASRHADDTVLIITADHGYHLGDKNRFRKFSLWEEADGVPIIIHDPAHPVKTVVKDPVASLDIGPTVMDYVGLPPLTECAGRSLKPQVRGKDVSGRAVPTFFFGSAGVRQGDYRYIRYQNGDSQLVDLRTDPWQLADAAPDHPERARMAKVLDQTTRDYGLTMLEQGQRLTEPANYVSMIGGAEAPDNPPTLGVFSDRPPHAGTWNAPGNRRYYVQHSDDMEMDLPAAYRVLAYAGDVGPVDKVLKVRLSDAGHHLDFVSTHQRCTLDVECGRGNDLIESLNEPMTVRLVAGTNTVRTGVRHSKIFGGSGNDQITVISSDTHIVGGSGDMTVKVEQGALNLTTAAGHNDIRCNRGESRIDLTRGRSIIDIGTDARVHLTFHRTGLPIRITGLAENSVDLCGWSAYAPLVFAVLGEDTVVTAGTERARFVATTEQAIRAAMTRPEVTKGAVAND